jgi:hypothetical protein
MPIPQVNDRIKEAPVVVLRAVFAGIGQILLTADKVRARAAEQAWTPDRAPVAAPRSTAPGPRNGITHAEPAIAEHSAVRAAPASPAPAPATQTAPITQTTPASKTARATKTRPASKTAQATKTAPATKTAKAVPAPRPKAAPVAAEPLPGWDDLSLASLRARLRGFDAATIRDMLAYEQAHARREPVLTMLERRLAKITAG